MAIRVRKLAKELQRSPVDILGVLHALGYARFRSPEDMLSGPVEKRLRGAVADGVRPLSVEPERVRKAAPEATALPPMPEIFAGVVRQKHDERYSKAPAAVPKPQPTRTSAPPVPPPAPAARPAAEDGVVEAERAAREAERRAMAAERSAISAERAALDAERAAWSIERKASPQGVPLGDVFEARGLRGEDEAQRAIRALAETRRIPELLPYLHVNDSVAVEAWLREVLVLVDGPPPEALEREALVSVARERADIPGAAAWRKIMGRLSEQLMLRGARRVTICGGGLRAQRLLRSGFDPRIEVRFRSGQRFTLADATSLAADSDAIALWNVKVPDNVTEPLDSAPVHVAVMGPRGLADFVKDWTKALAG